MGPTSATALESVSVFKEHYIRDRVRAFFRGAGRFLKMLFGLGSSSSQEAAAHLLLIVGFCVEGIVLFRVISDRGARDLPFSSHEGLEKLVPWVLFLLAMVTFLLFCHQFLIFRNFSVPTEVGRRVQLDQLAADIGTAVASLEQSDVGSGLSILRRLPILHDSSSDIGRGQLASLQGWIERLVFLFFGVLTGEAGYSLTVLHEHNDANQLVLSLERALGTHASWGLTLGSVFLACAATICALVLAWDAMVISSADTRARFGARLLLHFLVDDILSFAFWLCLFCVVTPTARLFLGVRGEYPTIGTLGYCSVAWFVLLVLSSLYVVALGRRVLVALLAFGSEPTYDDARYKIV